jgi:sulfite reductase alpha subunit-like flavoprotein
LYYDFCYRERRSWVEVFRDFSSLRPPLDILLSLIPRLLPRAFSIASPPHDEAVVLSVAVVEYSTPYGRKKWGTCSSWVNGLRPGVDKVPLWISSGTFPEAALNDLSVPLVMVGPGTGVAPMRSIAHHRSKLRSDMVASSSSSSSSSLTNICADLLFFGCRGQNTDFLFGGDLGTIEGLTLHTAFSREQTTPSGARLYVTHLIQQHGEVVFDAIMRGGYILVAGSAGAMPKDVQASFVSVIAKYGHMTNEQALDLVKKFERQRRYCVEAY